MAQPGLFGAVRAPEPPAEGALTREAPPPPRVPCPVMRRRVAAYLSAGAHRTRCPLGWVVLETLGGPALHLRPDSAALYGLD